MDHQPKITKKISENSQQLFFLPIASSLKAVCFRGTSAGAHSKMSHDKFDASCYSFGGILFFLGGKENNKIRKMKTEDFDEKTINQKSIN